MTRDDWIKHWKHEFAGMILQGYLSSMKPASERAIEMGEVQKKLDAHLPRMHDQAQPAANGAPAQSPPTNVRK